MFAGHLGAALILKDPKSRVGLGTLFFCAMLMDCILWVLVLAGVESVQIPPRLQSMADITFDFPYSHGLVAALIWAALAALVVSLKYRDHRASFFVAAAVLSHFTLDWLVHIPELPIAGSDSTKVGLGLWRNLPLAWSIEGLIVGAGLWIFFRRARLSTRRSVILVVVIVLLTVMTVVGQASKSPPPSIQAMAVSSLVAIAIITGFGWWIDRSRPAF
jgi:hypothetical protein